jgi:hypothetical protein
MAGCHKWWRSLHPDRGDETALSYYAGRADRRNGRPPAVDLADCSELGRRYLAGYGF